MIRISAALAAFGLMLPGCSTITEGSTQSIAVITDPPGAACNLLREGHSIGRVDPTPGSVLVEKTRQNINIECELEGYHKAAVVNESDVAAMAFGNLIAGGLIGVGIDAATGARVICGLVDSRGFFRWGLA